MLATCVVLAMAAVARTALGAPPAGDPPPVPHASTAAALFDAGSKAFAEGKFREAAQLFQRAHVEAPHPHALWNAGHAWARAGEAARAANAFSLYLEVAPQSAQDRAVAESKLAELSTGLARLLVEPSGLEDVRVDGSPALSARIWTDPGTHRITARLGGVAVRAERAVAAGETVRVVLEPPTAGPATSPPAAPAPAPAPRPPTPPPEANGGWSPAVFWIGAGTTALLGGATIVSGLATQSAHDRWVASPSGSGLDDGRGLQSLTNGLFWGTALVGALTAVCGVWLVRWGSSPPRTHAGLLAREF